MFMLPDDFSQRSQSIVNSFFSGKNSSNIFIQFYHIASIA